MDVTLCYTPGITLNCNDHGNSHKHCEKHQVLIAWTRKVSIKRKKSTRKKNKKETQIQFNECFIEQKVQIKVTTSESFKKKEMMMRMKDKEKEEKMNKMTKGERIKN